MIVFSGIKVPMSRLGRTRHRSSRKRPKCTIYPVFRISLSVLGLVLMVFNHSEPQGVPRQAQNIEICVERKIPAQVPGSVTNDLHQSLIFAFGIVFLVLF